MSKAQHSNRFMKRRAAGEAARSSAQMIDLRELQITQAALQFAPAFLRTRDVLRITSLSRATLYRRIAARRFPAPVHLGGRACGWPTAAIQDWISDPEGYGAPAAEDSAGIRARGRPLKYPSRSER